MTVSSSDLEVALERVDAFIAEEMASEGPPGIALAITDPERTLAVRTYGYANLDAKIPVDSSHLFQTGSTGKSFAAVMVMEEVERGRLRLDAPVTDYLPWFEVPSNYSEITLLHLMTHTAGISTGGEGSPGTEGEVYALRDSEAAWEPGTRAWYSNAGWKTIGLILERVNDKPYAQLGRERIFEPLGMSSSSGAITNDVRERCTVGYHRLFDDRLDHRTYPWIPAPFSESTSADGSLCCPVEDMAAFVRLILNRGRGPSGPIVSQANFDYLTQKFIQDRDEPEWWYGLGFFTSDVDGRRILGHSGGTLGFTTGMWTEDGLGVVILQNSTRGAWWLAPYVLGVTRAALDGATLPEPPARTDPATIRTAAEYAGNFRSGDLTIELVAEGHGLSMDAVPLEHVSGDTFMAPHPVLGRFPLRFAREEGVVVEVSHGPDRYRREGHAGRRKSTSPPAEWQSYAGHYRSHNPWSPSLRVFVRDDDLILATSNVDAGEAETKLVALASGRFRLGDTPEQIVFDTVIEGSTHRALLMNQPFFRTFTP